MVLEVLDRVRDSYNLDRLAQVAGVAALNDNAYYAEKLQLVLQEREKIERYFDSLGWRYFKSSANFVLFTPKTKDGKEGVDVAKSLFEYLRKNKILLRYFPNEASINMSIRLSIGTQEQMLKFVDATNQWINL
jgi:histidinol-phosphate aminotransferase